MTLKEVRELRRRFAPERNAVSRVYGCYVNGGGEIVSEIDAPLGLLSEEETEMYLELLRKTLSGSMGKNLVDVVFSTEQVAAGDEHRLLSDLRNSHLENPEARQVFYAKVIENLNLGENGYLILLASDQYDVPVRRKDGETDPDASENVFSYIVCAVCPIRDPSLALRYFHDAKEFHSSSTGQTVAPPALGFLFPAFDDRAANLYNALYYVRKPAEPYWEFLAAVFGTEPPMSSEEQREAFHNVLTQSLAGECGFDVLQTVHEQLLERIEQHREEKDPEPLSLSPREVRGILENGGVSEERLEAFEYAAAEHFGQNAALSPGNIIDTKRFEIVTPEVKISVNPSCSYVVESRVIDGRRYLLIPVGSDVTVNGVPVREAVESPDGEAAPLDVLSAAASEAPAPTAEEIAAENVEAPGSAPAAPDAPDDVPPWE